MMLALAFILPLVAALACLGLSRVAPARWCALGVAAALLAACALLAASRPGPAGATVLDARWLETSDVALRVALRLDGQRWALALLALGASALGSLGLALALPRDLRGFGGLPAAVALVALATLAGLATAAPLQRPAAWMLGALAAAAALRASSSAAEDPPLIVLLAGGCAAVMLLGSALVGGSPRAEPLLIGAACVLTLGVAPFNSVAGAYGEAPAGLGGLLLAVGLPLVAGQTLIDSAPVFAASPQRSAAITVVGLASLLACAAGALGATRGRRLVAWQHGAVQSLLLVAVGQGAAGQRAASALLVAGALTTLAASLAVSLIEQRAGTDDLAAAQLPAPLELPGAALLVAGAAALGAPGTFGFWARSWLADALAARQAGWAAGVLLAGSGLLALSYLAPLATLWRSSAEPGPPGRARLATAPPAVAALALLLLGIAPQAVDRLVAPRQPTTIAVAAAALALAVVPLAILRGRAHRPQRDPDESAAGAALPRALGESVAGLAAIAAPGALLGAAWAGLLRTSELLARTLARVEQRYYMAGLTMALIVVILIFL